MRRNKVAIKYGIGEGDYHGRVFVYALEQAGFTVIRNARKADIIITHSGGCFFLPPPDKNQIYIFINPPYWPGKSLVISTLQKVLLDFWDYLRDGQVRTWLWKTFINLVHIVRYIIKTLFIALNAHRQRFYKVLSTETALIIRSNSDTFLAPNADMLLQEQLGRTISMKHLPGQHDTCWRYPTPYVEAIASFIEDK